ncbi:hypothetical protein PUNSTDRAFT_146338 [Punctularia strigosozonata HHB-11173 SS5]|uniref:DUF6534 domain-containing protein n=1 Tax=Punctularia strigosozonata (strain HHB-11173) TaxID=741275 RepID=R7S4A9_PUNST|nr:uncharacterized protein PUNSTDRAFT_146338 [Punctularia strigosozonata HHB-11173 SS5]EIN04684.1 hypothetical protein PUNSTDRAFT_146338 [Punctularia strigosozonata HHB-11173 SS5]
MTVTLIPDVYFEDHIVDSYEWALWGIFFGAVLCGISIMQTWTYVHNNNDRLSLRVFVLVTVLFDTAAIVSVPFAFINFIESYGDIPALLKVPVAFPIETSLSSSVIFMVQIYFVHQLYVLSQRMTSRLRPLRVVAGFFTCAGFVLSWLMIAASVIAPDIPHLNSGSFCFYTLFCSIALLLSDVLATISFCSVLQSFKTGLGTDNFLKKLGFYLLVRGYLVTACQLVTLILFLWRHVGMEWTLFHILLSKVYVITMLAMLNSRRQLRALLEDVSVSLPPIPSGGELRFADVSTWVVAVRTGQTVQLEEDSDVITGPFLNDDHERHSVDVTDSAADDDEKDMSISTAFMLVGDEKKVTRDVVSNMV